MNKLSPTIRLTTRVVYYGTTMNPDTMKISPEDRLDILTRCDERERTVCDIAAWLEEMLFDPATTSDQATMIARIVAGLRTEAWR